jgi:hypothetical protein
MRRTAPAVRQKIRRSIVMVRGQKVILDSDLADLYGVATKALVQAVKRNRSRFPADFMLHLSAAKFLGRPPKRSMRIYRAGCCDAVERAA